LKDQRKKVAEQGRELLEKKFYKAKIDFTLQNVNEFFKFLRLPNSQELFLPCGFRECGYERDKRFSEA